MNRLTKKRIRPQKITEKNFKPFGKIIDFPARAARSRGENLFRIVVRQPRTGWRIAYLIVRDKTLTRLEKHPGSLETFEPVSGMSVLFVSLRRDPRHIRSFFLDKPVILKKGLWHGIVTLGRECDVKIVENSRVTCVYWPLGSILHA